MILFHLMHCPQHGTCIFVSNERVDVMQLIDGGADVMESGEL